MAFRCISAKPCYPGDLLDYRCHAHTPDNSFLGFVVEQHLNASDVRHIDDIKRQNQSLVYGKVDNFWKDKKKYLDVIHSYMEVHGTVHGTSTVHLPAYVKNHGILSGRDLQFLLRETKLFVGLSFPYEGPAPLEAIANGCAFLNPRFDPSKSSKNTDFFKGKPTLRELTSQHPYAEVYIGRPHVWTVNIDDPAEVENAIKAILSQKIEPYLPYEFTCEGMLQRVNAFIENQVMWPPLSAMQVKFAPAGKSCKQVCQEEQLICEPSFFQHLNKDKDLFRIPKYICHIKALWAMNGGIHIKQFQPPRPKPVPRNKNSSTISASDMGINDEEWERLQKVIEWPGPDQEITHLNQSTSPVHSSFSVVGLKESYKVGEKISVTITARDHNKNLKRYGGDFFKAKLFNSKLKASVYGEVVDHRNGTYSVNFLLPWEGIVEKCRSGLKTPVPAGFYLKDIWKSFVCNTRQFSSAEMNNRHGHAIYREIKCTSLQVKTMCITTGLFSLDIILLGSMGNEWWDPHKTIPAPQTETSSSK
ncbi:Alpha-1,6-mannosylglyco 6-beta-N-acetylglucosaminyltransferase A-like protein [Labeo rohita]|uniref:alpha-1,6-mannosyl-glycoprotein 6-beta-N-acetylglucosaminyltransferase n=1 Tax=Labeo rohita TaxID=84645 RepID=A0A498LVJ2_LABRO|nr:Alpha-1,6-mannosylglyco 6-beta-N-acetylglucosaminyltransferase A-like protein [Labeo rohita]